MLDYAPVQADHLSIKGRVAGSLALLLSAKMVTIQVRGGMQDVTIVVLMLHRKPQRANVVPDCVSRSDRQLLESGLLGSC